MSGRITTVSKPPKLERKKRVAAYARVSSGKDAMLHSLSAQVSHYSDLIQRNSDWLYAGVYADEAKTGTKDSRADFQRLIADCHAGKIDMKPSPSVTKKPLRNWSGYRTCVLRKVSKTRQWHFTSAPSKNSRWCCVSGATPSGR